jgi:hypothetical protein
MLASGLHLQGNAACNREAAAGASDGGVCSLSWSRDGRHLLAGGPGHQLVLWDVLAQMPASQVELPAQVKHVALTARPPYLALATLVDAAPILVNTSTGSMHVLSSFVPGVASVTWLDCGEMVGWEKAACKDARSRKGTHWVCHGVAGAKASLWAAESVRAAPCVYWW